jgi:AraC-like DNA-binding protein
MRPQFEKIRSSSTSFVAFARSDPSFPFVWHYHPEYELTLIVDGYGQRFVGDAIMDYAPGDLVLLGPDLPHTWRSAPAPIGVTETHRAIVVQFHAEFLGKQFFALQEMSSVSQLLSRASCGLAFGSTKIGVEVAKRMLGMISLHPSRRLLLLLSILVDLAVESDAQPLSTSNLKLVCRAEDQHRIQIVCSHLSAHFGGEIDYAQLAREIRMDLASLCRFFKRATGRTMTAYVNELRVAAAARLLRETDLNILEIGLQAGFGNYSNFNRQFKRIKGFGPRTLRREFPTNAETRVVGHP